jgi:hypothetical protein
MITTIVAAVRASMECGRPYQLFTDYVWQLGRAHPHRNGRSSLTRWNALVSPDIFVYAFKLFIGPAISCFSMYLGINLAMAVGLVCYLQYLLLQIADSPA